MVLAEASITVIAAHNFSDERIQTILWDKNIMKTWVLGSIDLCQYATTQNTLTISVVDAELLNIYIKKLSLSTKAFVKMAERYL